MDKPSLPKGTRDFGPAQMAKRQYILDRIKTVFQKYGFQPLETPAMENLTTLTGKYGDEGDQLLFKVLDSGAYFEKLKLDLENSKRLAKIKDVFHSTIKDLAQQSLVNLDYESTKDFFKIKEFIEPKIFDALQKHSDSLSSSDKEIANAFLNDFSYLIAFQIGKFFYETRIPLDKFYSQKELIDGLNSQFSQFRDSSLNNILIPKFLTYFSSKEVTKAISEKGLRYDLTVPFARYVVMNRHEITFPFKRYQIQPVWRADRPQKGRYREFYQCDADVVGTDSLLCEADIVLMITEVFSQLHIQDYTIKINHRGILFGLAEICGAKENETPLFVAIDKLDKIGEEKVKEELRARGFQEESLTTLFQILNFKGNTQQKIDFLSAKFSASENGQKGLSDFQKVLELLNGYQFNPEHLEFDISLARGLSYYTGCIFEVKINNVAIGSVSGGGRYDNLTGSFGLEGVSGIGISFGVDRLYDAMEELKLFPSEAMISSTVMIAHFDNETMRYGLQVAARLRAAGVATELYPDISKIKKQMEYANKKLIPYVIVIGADEMTDGQLTLKRMHTGEQEKKTLEEILLELKK